MWQSIFGTVGGVAEKGMKGLGGGYAAGFDWGGSNGTLTDINGNAK